MASRYRHDGNETSGGITLIDALQLGPTQEGGRMAVFRGKQVEEVWFDRKRDEYRLYSPDGGEVATISRAAFLSQPQLRKVRHGRHRRTATEIYSGAAGQSYISTGAWTYATFSGAVHFSFHSAERKPIEDAGIRAGEITAIRAWRLHGERLFSVYANWCEWRAGEVMQGDVRHEYGVHGFKALSSLSEYLWWKQFDSPGFGEEPTFVVGTAALWGEVVEHERGYRAEFAKIATLDFLDGWRASESNLLNRLRARYGLQQNEERG